MPSPSTERRACAPQSELDAGCTATIVRRGLRMQRDTGTVSALEYLKANAVGAAVIRRVLSGQALREDDALALDLVAAEA